jgi:hypothetical protein
MMARVHLFLTALLVVASTGAWCEGRDEKIVNPKPDRTWTSRAGGLFTSGKSIAVVIGISNFIGERNGGYAALPSAKDDAEKMKRFLIDDAGFDTVYILTDDNATKEKVERLMTDEIPQMVGPQDRFLFYWSGHGDQMVGTDRSAFGFLPVARSKARQFSTMISMEDIARWDRYLSARHALFVLDACLSGLAGVERKSARDTRLDQLSQTAHQLITAGTGTENVISSDKWRGSLFTDSFIVGAKAEARQSFGVVSLYSLIDFIQERVSLEKEAARWSMSLTPQIRNLRAGDGAFFFTRAIPSVAMTPPVSARVELEPKAPAAPPAAPVGAQPLPPTPPTQPAVALAPAAPPAALPKLRSEEPRPTAPVDRLAGLLNQIPVKLSDKDKVRFATFEQTRADVIVKAKKASNSQKDVASLTAVLSGDEMPITQSDLIGDWRCRSAQAGGLGVFVYDFFKCRISVSGGAVTFQKVSGSQRTQGTLHRLTDTRYVYVGAWTVNDDPPMRYGADPEHDVVAYLVKVGNKRLRLELPDDTNFEFIELVK